MASATVDSELKVKIGKMIFYITCAVGLWFFYWFNGIMSLLGRVLQGWNFLNVCKV